FLAGLALLAFLAFATIIGCPALVGSFGASFATRNIELFGVLAYVYLFALIYASYKLYKNPVVDFKRASFTAAVSLLFILFLMLQSIVFEATEYQGIIGTALVDGITPVIGRGGFWIVWACSFVLSLALMAEEGVDRLFQKTMIFLGRLKPSFSLAKNNKTSNKESVQKQSSARQADVEAEVAPIAVAPFVADTITQIAEDETPKSEPQTEKPKRAKKTASNDVEIVTELEENKALLDEIELGESGKPKGWKLPSSDFFAKSVAKKSETNEDEIDEKIKELIEKLRRFKIDGDVIRTYAGPVVTTFEFKPAAHIKVSRISQLQDDIAMALKAQTIRIQAPIPGKDVVGIEIPNKEIETIYMRDIIESD
ncbi:MAG TPA: DNA translocase FtsK 4TM domain-containing protein, partial [Campylobacterales bacterium]|nr:DNA translocase FtsK 4TM domain-containing protein [Campylobacterales bacterium]